MFVTKNQIFVFIACVAFGGIGGILFSFSAGIKSFIKNRVLKCLPDLISMLILGAVFCLYSHFLNFPNLRTYMIAGVFIGNVLYFKSFHILLAKCVKKFYNIIEQKINRRRKVKDERIKVKKINNRNNRRGGVVASDFAIDNGVSVSVNRRSSKANRRVRRTDKRLSSNGG